MDYEIAQQPIYAVRLSGETLHPVADELKVLNAKTVYLDRETPASIVD